MSIHPNRHGRHTTPTVAAAISVLVICLAGTTATAGDARSSAMGGVRTAVADGLDAAVWNPASLAFTSGRSVGLASVAVDIHNNSFTLGRYNDVSGATLSNADKEELLADIPDGGFRMDANAQASLLGLQIGNFAVTTGALAAGRGNLDRDFFDLLLFGNEVGQTVDFSDTWGDGYAVGHMSLSWGRLVSSGERGELAVGLTASYLKGLYSLHVEEAHGSVTTSRSEISGEAFAAVVTADGGSGLGVDLGVAWQALNGWTYGLTLDNLVSKMTWSGQVERHEIRVTADDINALNDDLDNAVADTDTTYAVGNFGRGLPRLMRLGAARDLGTVLLAADYAQGFSDRAGASTTPQLNLGVEWRALGWLSPRGGMSLGGAPGFGLAGGMGIDLAWWSFDLAVLHRGGVPGRSPRGLGFGLSSQVHF